MFDIQTYLGVGERPLRYGVLHNPDPAVQGKVLLFVPGLGGSVKGALGFLECLSPSFEYIYGPDLRSFGLNTYDDDEDPLSHTRDILPDIEAFYRQIIEPRRKAGQIQDLTLCGISLGGVTATLMATNTPERFERLVLLAPAYKPHKQSFPLSYTIKNIFVYLLKGGRTRVQIPYGLTQLTSNEALLNDPAYRDHAPLRVAIGYLLGISLFCWRALQATRKITLPTLVVIPGKDVICDPAAMRHGFAQIPASTTKMCREYPEFYHDVLFESGHPEIAEDMVRWMHQLDMVEESHHSGSGLRSEAASRR